jgi:predicted Zn-dependent protease
MTTLEGYYFGGLHPVAEPAKMDFADDGEALLTAGPVLERFVAAHLKVSPRIGSTDRFISLPKGGQFTCPDSPVLDTLPQESPSEGPVAWLEERWGVALACVVVVLCSLLAAYFFGLPAAAERVAAHIPMETEQALGGQVLTWLDGKGWLKRTAIDAETQKTIRHGFDRLRTGLPLENYLRLEFRSSMTFGANAVALPGGTIVITDAMIKAAESPEEVLSVLAHEIGHVELRHTMRTLLQNSAIAIVVAAVTADAATLSAAIAGLPVLVAERKYSREFEFAADDYAFRLLKQKGYSPAAFASLMERLAKKEGAEKAGFAYLSTHPITKERVQRARNAAPDDSSGKERE